MPQAKSKDETRALPPLRAARTHAPNPKQKNPAANERAGFEYRAPKGEETPNRRGSGNARGPWHTG